jgi:hypothetical protein
MLRQSLAQAKSPLETHFDQDSTLSDSNDVASHDDALLF